MFRNQYDNDITVWSPQGRIHQIEYAMEAVKQGSAAVGLKSKTHSIILALKRSSSELASYQKKIFKIDEHVGIAIAGLTSDARVLSNFMRTECLRSRFVYNRPLPVQRLVNSVGDKAQINTQRYGSRPYGVGLLVVGYDGTGAHLYEFSPSGNCFDYIAMSIGARSQSAKTYLEKNFESFEGATLNDLIKHGLFALRDTLQGDTELTSKNCSIGVVGEGYPFKVLEGEELEPYLALLEGVTRRVGPEPVETEQEQQQPPEEQPQQQQPEEQQQDDQDSPQPFMQTE